MAVPRGEVLTLERTWALAQLWYADRMEPGFRGRSVAEAHQLFRQLGLSAPFWYLDPAAAME